MSRLRYLNPFRIHDTVRRIREVSGGGGPAAVRLAGVTHPRGWFIPTSRVSLEVIARDGSVTRFAPEVPVPFPYAWGYRIARRLNVPFISRLDPERFETELPIPGR